MAIIERFGRRAVERLNETEAGDIYLLSQSYNEADRNPGEVAKLFYGYYRLIKHVFNLTEAEKAIIIEAEKRINRPHRSLENFLDATKGHEERVLEVVRHMGVEDSEINHDGLWELGFRMRNAARKKLSDPEWKPSDGDPYSDKVIWGFVNRDEMTDPRVEWHLVICHAIERTLTVALEHSHIEFTEKKDWLFAGITGLITMNGLMGKGFEAEIFDVWRAKRPEGLGWISDDRVAAYKSVLKID